VLGSVYTRLGVLDLSALGNTKLRRDDLLDSLDN
jgi:hypothetical protein